MNTSEFKENNHINRRSFVKKTGLLAGAASLLPPFSMFGSTLASMRKALLLDDFIRADSLQAGDQWESLNPGYWQIKNNALRRRLKNVGDKARSTGFPYHYETHSKNGQGVMKMDYDPSLPLGITWNRQWKTKDNYALAISGDIHNLAPVEPLGRDKTSWRNYKKGNGVLGLAFGGNTQFESFHSSKNSCWMAAIKDDGTFGILKHDSWKLSPVGDDGIISIKELNPGDTFEIKIAVQKKKENSKVTARLTLNGKDTYEVSGFVEEIETEGYFGIAGRGLLDFSMDKIELESNATKQLDTGTNECHACYALGDTLKLVEGQWTVRFMALFRNDGENAEIRISDSRNPSSGWKKVKVAGSSEIISNDFRRNTAVIDAVLPFNPADKEMYYTIWKDGVDVTADPRIGTDAVGSGTGVLGDVPSSPMYVGRLPQLKAPYKICGLSCHAIHAGKANLSEGDKRWSGYYVHDQPTHGSYKHLEAYNFQVMLWEDDVWYMELLLYPPSTDDAYKIVTTSICGPTSRWQMMRHWNVLNPGDHDHGMDDVKGPEQLAIRNNDNLGQDSTYMIRNFQIVSHLMTGKENPSGTDNPKRWRKWKMPNKDFTLMVMDSRLWRSSQDTNIWDDEGWGHEENIYSRTDPTRSLLGEEQFAWLQENIHTDTSPIICLTGINALHSIWKGTYWGENAKRLGPFNSRDRVAADYAGWVASGADRIIELLGSRDGIVSVYGDVHVGSIIKNTDHNLVECSFGPIGRTGGRAVVDGFGPVMKDFDGRPIEAIALYHEKYDNVKLEKEDGPKYWNFMEMNFDPSYENQRIEFKIRNIIDAPTEKFRGGNYFSGEIQELGRDYTSTISEVKTIPNADVLILTMEGKPIRGTRTNAEGKILLNGLMGVIPGEKVILVSNDGEKSETNVFETKVLEHKL